MIIATVNEKGGPGKTSTSVNLLGGLALRGRNPIMLDCDGSGRAAMILREIADKDSLLQRFCFPVPDANHMTISKAIDDNSTDQTIDAIIDTRPAIDTAFNGAVGLADVVIVPSKISRQDVELTKKSAREARFLSKDAPVYILPTAVEYKDNLNEEVISMFEALSDEGIEVLPSIRKAVAVPQAMFLGQSVFEAAPAAPVTQDYLQVIDMLIDRERVLLDD